MGGLMRGGPQGGAWVEGALEAGGKKKEQCEAYRQRCGKGYKGWQW